jgi:protein arginine N-methyltransferase 6
MAAQLHALVAHNNLQDVIVVVPKPVEDLNADDIPEGTVDAIVSEWMGFGLLHENMLPSVLCARDRGLTKAPHALMLPSHARLYAAPSTIASTKVSANVLSAPFFKSCF